MPQHHQHEEERHQEEDRGDHPVALAGQWYQVQGGRLAGVVQRSGRALEESWLQDLPAVGEE